MDLRRVQQEAWDNKLAHGFNTTDVPADLKRLHREVDEAEKAWQGGGENFGSELADGVIFLAGLAQMAELDLGAEVKRKLAVNSEPLRAAARRPPGQGRTRCRPGHRGGLGHASRRRHNFLAFALSYACMQPYGKLAPSAVR